MTLVDGRPRQLAAPHQPADSPGHQHAGERRGDAGADRRLLGGVRPRGRRRDQRDQPLGHRTRCAAARWRCCGRTTGRRVRRWPPSSRSRNGGWCRATSAVRSSRDRVFFFANYEYNPLKAPQPVTIDRRRGRGDRLPASDLGNSPFGETFHTPSVKVNFRANDRNSGFVRYNRFTNDQPGAGGGLTTPSRSVSFKDRMYGIGAQLATTVGSGRAERAARRLQPPRAKLREPYVRGRRRTARTSTSPASPTSASTRSPGSASVEASLQVIDNLTWTRGRHSLKTGVDFQTTGFDVTSALARVFTFSGLAGRRRPRRGDAARSVPEHRRAARSIRPPAGRSPTRSCSRSSAIRRCRCASTTSTCSCRTRFALRPDLTLSAGVRYELHASPGARCRGAVPAVARGRRTTPTTSRRASASRGGRSAASARRSAAATASSTTRPASA